MKIIFLHIMLILSNSLLSAQPLTIPKDYYYYQVTVEVARVIDGDTFVLSDSTHVRLLGVDTPELNKKSIEDTLFADSAAAFLRNLIDKKSIKLTFDLSPFTKGGNTNGIFYDIYGRLLSLCLAHGLTRKRLIIYSGRITKSRSCKNPVLPGKNEILLHISKS